jgi:hypothetical protein
MEKLPLFRDGDDGWRRERGKTVLGTELRGVTARNGRGPASQEQDRGGRSPRPDSSGHRPPFYGVYSGRRFQPVIIDAKLSQPCRATMIR